MIIDYTSKTTGESVSIPVSKWEATDREDYPFKALISFYTTLHLYSIITLLVQKPFESIHYVLNKENDKFYVYATAKPATEVELMFKIED